MFSADIKKNLQRAVSWKQTHSSDKKVNRKKTIKQIFELPGWNEKKWRLLPLLFPHLHLQPAALFQPGSSSNRFSSFQRENLSSEVYLVQTSSSTANGRRDEMIGSYLYAAPVTSKVHSNSSLQISLIRCCRPVVLNMGTIQAQKFANDFFAAQKQN